MSFVTTAVQNPPPPLIPIEVASIILSYEMLVLSDKELVDSPDPKKRVAAIAATFGLGAEKLFHACCIDQLRQTTILPTDKTHALHREATAQVDTAAKKPEAPFDAELLFKEYDWALTNCGRAGAVMPGVELFLVFFHLHFCRVPYVYHPDRLTLRINTSPDKPESAAIAPLWILTLLLKHYPSRSYTILSAAPLNDATRSLLHNTVPPKAVLVDSTESLYSVGKWDHTTNLFTLDDHEFRHGFLTQAFVTALLDSGKQLSRDDLTRALVVTLMDDFWTCTQPYVERLLDAGASPTVLVSRITHPANTFCFYENDPKTKGIPLLFAVHHELSLQKENPSSDALLERLKLYEETLLPLLTKHGASYAPANLLHLSETQSNFVDFLVIKGANRDEASGEPQMIDAFIAETNILPNAHSIVSILTVRASDAMRERAARWISSPSVLDQILKNSKLLREVLSHPAFRAACLQDKKSVDLPIQTALGYTIEHCLDNVDPQNYSPTTMDRVYTQFLPYKTAQIKIDRKLEPTVVGFLKIVRKLATASATGEETPQNIARLLKTFESAKILDNPRDFLIGALDYAEKSPAHTSLQGPLQKTFKLVGVPPSALS
jgi:hypothetical protein